MEKQIYFDCAKYVSKKLHEEVNGFIKFEVYPEIDTIIFKIVFKDFNFNYPMNNIQEMMYVKGLDEEVETLLKKYKKAILNGFFKSDQRKERDKMKRARIATA